jgi:hypothetical protein
MNESTRNYHAHGQRWVIGELTFLPGACRRRGKCPEPAVRRGDRAAQIPASEATTIAGCGRI